MMPNLLISLKNCARCGKEHEALWGKEFVQPFAPPECAPLAWTHWATCPVTKDPILFMQTDSPPEGREGTYKPIDELIELDIFLGKLAADSMFKKESISKWRARLSKLQEIIHNKLNAD